LQDTELAESRTKVEAALATVLGDTGRYKESLEIQQATLKRLLKFHEREHPRVAQALHDIAVTLNMDGQYAASRLLSSEVFEFNRKFYGPDHPRTSNMEYNLGLVLQREGDHGEAETHFRSVINSRSKNSLRKDDPEMIDCIRSLAQCLEKQQKYQAANEYYQTAYQQLLEKSGIESTHTVALGEGIARTLKLKRQLDESTKESKEESTVSGPIHVIFPSGGGGGGGSGRRRGRYPRDDDYGGI
jgi:tetratricopeptide (TPR) repeat protein